MTFKQIHSVNICPPDSWSTKPFDFIIIFGSWLPKQLRQRGSCDFQTLTPSNSAVEHSCTNNKCHILTGTAAYLILSSSRTRDFNKFQNLISKLSSPGGRKVIPKNYWFFFFFDTWRTTELWLWELMPVWKSLDYRPSLQQNFNESNILQTSNKISYQ